MADTTETPTAGGVERPAVGNTTPSAMELMRQGLEGVEDQPDEQDPWATLGEGAREIAEKKGWKSPEDMLKAYEAATARLSQRDEDREALMAEIEKMQSEREPQQYQPQPNGNGQQQPVAPYDFDALAASLTDPNTGEMNMARALEVAVALGANMAYQAAEARMEERFAQFEQQRVAPLSARAEEERVEQELQELSDRYGEDVYTQIEARVLERMKEEPDYVDRLGGVRGAFADTLYDLQHEELEQREREAAGHTMRGGGRRPAQPVLTPEQRELADMDRMRWRPNDGFALHNRLRWG